MTSPPPVFEISSRNRFAPLCETECEAVIIGDSVVRHVRATLAEGKVHTHCFPGVRVLDVSVQIPAILKDDESVTAIAAVVIHAGETKLRQTETLKRDFRSLIETVRSTSPAFLSFSCMVERAHTHTGNLLQMWSTADLNRPACESLRTHCFRCSYSDNINRLFISARLDSRLNHAAIFAVTFNSNNLTALT